jgi:hypothetical protein
MTAAETMAGDLGYDAACDYCDARLSDDDGEPGPFTYKDADDWAYWHKKECEPEVKIMSPEDLAREQEWLARMKERYPEVPPGGES